MRHATDLFAGVHEVGHIAAARSRGVDLGRPFLIPAGLGFLGGQHDSQACILFWSSRVLT